MFVHILIIITTTTNDNIDDILLVDKKVVHIYGIHPYTHTHSLLNNNKYKSKQY